MHLKEKLKSIELLRYLAASAVMLIHLPFDNLAYIFDGGIDLFFIISGFVIMISTAKSKDNFFAKRLIKILPIYYICTLGLFFLMLLKPSFFTYSNPNLINLIKSLLFIPYNNGIYGHHPIFILGWTLNYQMFFYLLFAFAIKINYKKRDLVVTLLISFAYLISKEFNFYPFLAYSNTIIFDFILGIVVYQIFINKKYLKALSLLTFPLIVLILSNNLEGRFFDVGIYAGLFLLFSLYIFLKIKLPSQVKVMGGYSYSLYLIHTFIIQFFNKLINWFSIPIFYKISATTLLILLINLFAYIIWRYFEIPVTNILRKKLIYSKVTKK